MPTETALVCSMKPILLRSVSRGTGTRTAEAASNDEVWMAGMSSGAKNARMVCRTMSVPMTRVMPMRCASCVARVLLPTPVAPPMRMMSGVSQAAQLLPLAEALDEHVAALAARAGRGRCAAGRRE